MALSITYSTPDHQQELPDEAYAAYAAGCPGLLPQHAALLQASGITPAIAAARCYMSVHDDTEGRLLSTRGFSKEQRKNKPGLLMPLCAVDGGGIEWECLRWGKKQTYLLAQYRPDTPYIDANGEATRYVIPAGAPVRLDCHPRSMDGVANASVPLWLTEGIRKGDALTSAGACAVAMLGVTMWQKALKDWQMLPLRGRTVIIAFDSDVTANEHVAQQEAALARHLVSKGAFVRLCRLPAFVPGQKTGIDDYLGAGYTLDDAEACCEDWMGTATVPVASHDGRPLIQVTTDIPSMVDEGQAALLALPEPVLYQRTHRLVVMTREGVPPKWLRRAPGAPGIQAIAPAHLTELVARAARWVKFDGRKKEWVDAVPYTRFAETLLARPEWPFPLLEGVIGSPTLRPDGSVIATPGYDASTGLYFSPNDSVFPALPDEVTVEDVEAAIQSLYEVVEDFPFLAPHHKSAWLTAIVTIACRYTIHGCVPLFGITATTRGSGKSLLADTISLIGTGHEAAKWSQVHDEDEERKRLMAIALEGDPLVCIDNVTRPFGSGAMAAAITGGSIQDRILGASESRKAPLNTTFLATGNNLQYIETMSRRVIPIAIDPQMERPEERTGFRIPHLRTWIQAVRPELLIAALTIVKGFMDAGQPKKDLRPLGGFEAWSDVIRQAVVWAGEADPCEGCQEVEQRNDPEYERLSMLLFAWAECYGESAKTLPEVLDDIGHYAQAVGPESTVNQWNRLKEALGAYDRRYDGRTLRAQALGWALKGAEGRVIGHKRLHNTQKKSHNNILWALRCDA